MESPRRALGKKHGFGGFAKRVLRFPKGEEQKVSRWASLPPRMRQAQSIQGSEAAVPKFSAYFRRRLAALRTEHKKLGCFAALVRFANQRAKG